MSDSYIPIGEARGCCSRLKTSPRVVVAVVCIAMFTDSLLLTLVDPILPKMLQRIEINRLRLNALYHFNTSGIVYPVGPSNDTRVEAVLFEKEPGLANSISETNDDWKNNGTWFGNTGNAALVVGYQEMGPKSNTSNDLNRGGKFGYLVAAKGAAQFIFNPFVGHITTRCGYRSPMLFGSLLLAGSTLAFGYSVSYWMLMVCRVFQGLASSLTAVTSLGLLADTFRNDKERGKVVGYAFGGLSLGIIAGPIYGSILYDFVGPEFPFQLLSAIIFISVGVQILTYQRRTNKKTESPAAIFHLVKDPYVLIVAANIFLLNLDTSIVLAFLPLELMRLVDPPTWQLGIVVLPTSVGYLLAGVICPRIIGCLPRWCQGLSGMIISAGTLMALAYSYTFVNMLIVTTFLGLAIGMISTSMQPIFAYLVDIRHNDVYGNVYAISDMAVCLAMFVGPLVGGPVLYAFSFQTLLFGAAVLDLLSAPLCFLLRNPPRGQKIIDEEKSNSRTDSDNNQITYSYQGHDEREPILCPSYTMKD